MRQATGVSKVNPAPRTVFVSISWAFVEPPQPERMKTTATGKPSFTSKRKEPPSMAKTKDRVSDAADTVKPYVDRALHDAELRDNVRAAYQSARSIYDELIGNRGVTGVATRVATDKDIQDELRRTVDELRRA